MNTNVALSAALLTLALAVTGGCATDAIGDDVGVESTQQAIAIGTQTVNLYASSLGAGAARGSDQASPVKTFQYANGTFAYNTFTGTIFEATVKGVHFSKDVLDLAFLLKLGVFTGTEGAAGSTFYDFGSGGFIRVINETGAVAEVSLRAAGKSISLSAAAALSAARSRVGTFVSASDSGSVRTVRFTSGSVIYNTLSGAVIDVTLTIIAGPDRAAARSLDLGAFVRGTHERGIDHDIYARGTVHFDTIRGAIISVSLPDQADLSAQAVDLAVNLKLGAFIGADGAAGTLFVEFANGVIAINQADNVVRSVEIELDGELVPLPLPVANAASANVFGLPIAIEGAAGSVFYTFADGVIHWSNVTESLAEVTLR
jgi:hypothetical protein